MTDLNSESFSALNFWKSVEKKNISTNFGSSTSKNVVTPSNKKNLNSFPLLAPPAPPPPPPVEFTNNINNNNGNSNNNGDGLSNTTAATSPPNNGGGSISGSTSSSFIARQQDGLSSKEWDEQNVTEAFGFWKQKAVQLQKETERYNARRNARQTIDLTNILRKSTSSDLLMKPQLDSPPLTPPYSGQDDVKSPSSTTSSSTTTTTARTTTTTTTTTTTSDVVLLQANQLEIKYGGETIAVVDDSGTTPRDYRRSRSISMDIIPPKGVTTGEISSSPTDPSVSSTKVEVDSDSSDEESDSSEEDSDDLDSDDLDSDAELATTTPRKDDGLHPINEVDTPIQSSLNSSVDQQQVATIAAASSVVVVQQPLKPDQASENSNVVVATVTTTAISESSTTTKTADSSVASTATTSTTVPIIQTPSSPTTTTAAINNNNNNNNNSNNNVTTAPPSPSSQRASTTVASPPIQTTPSTITKPASKDKTKDPNKKSIGATLTRTVTKTFIRDSKENNKFPSGTSPSTVSPAAQAATTKSSSSSKDKVKISKQEKDRIKQEKTAQKKKEKDEKKQQKSNKKALTKNLSSSDVKKGFISPQQQQIIDSPYRIFGVRLTQLVLSNDGDLPAILTQTITVLSNSNNLDVNAIFVGAENDGHVREIRKKSDFERIDFSVIGDPRVVAGLLILFFAELPQPLFNSKFFGDLIEINDITNLQVKLNDLKYLINSLSQLRRSLLQILVTFFMSKYINGNATTNRSVAIQSLASSFGPQFFRGSSFSNSSDAQMNAVGEETLKLIIDNYVFLFEKTNEPDVKFKNVDGKMLISEGTIEKLIDKATDHYYPYNEKYFSLTFFITHLYFIQPSELVDKLIQLYKENHDTLETKKKWKKQRRSKKAGCINDAVKLWVDYCYKEMREDKELSKKILKGFPHLEAQLSSRLSHKTTINEFLKLPKRVHSRTRSASFSETFLSSGGSINGSSGSGSNTQLSAMEIAEQCTLVDYDLFTNVRLSDWVRLMQGSVDPITAPALSMALKRSTIWSQWAMGEILSTEDKNQRVAIINLLVDVAINCRDLANFNTCISIYNALTNHHIKRLQLTWESVPKETLNKISQLEQSLSVWLKPDSVNPFSTICQSINSACVPHFSILRTVLSQIDQKIPTFTNTDPDNHFVNVEKLRTIFGIVVEIQRLQQQRNYTMKPTKLFIQLQDINTVSMDELADLSLKCEPPISKAKKYNAPEPVDEDWRVKITKTFNKPLATTSVGIDLPRLASSFTFGGNASNVVCSSSAPGNKIHDIYNVLVSLSQLEGDQQLQLDVVDKFANYIPFSTDPDSDFKRELLRFLDEVCHSDQSKLVRILKCCNQAIIAPVIIEITLNIARNTPFMDAGGWRILISDINNSSNNGSNVTLDKKEESENDNQEDSLSLSPTTTTTTTQPTTIVEQSTNAPTSPKLLFIRHYKKQRSRSAQQKDYFEFEWFIQLNLDLECKNIQSFELKISSLVFSTETTPTIRDQLLESLKIYLLSPDVVQYINFNENVKPQQEVIFTQTSTTTNTVVQESSTTTSSATTSSATTTE